MQSTDLQAQAQSREHDGSRLLDRPLLSIVRIDWETIAWAVLIVGGAFGRFYNLGQRAMSHDESLHALYSYYLYNAGNYEHNPMMHGPLLFHVNSLVYFLFGDSDATARLAPALAGVLVIGMIYFLRRYIGAIGALAAGTLVALSPSLLFHSRYIRNDIYIALFTLMWIYGSFRYLEVSQFAVDDEQRRQKGRWLTFMVLGMALGFIAKENHFIHGAVLGIFFSVYALWRALKSSAFVGVAPLLLAGGIAFTLYEMGQSIIALLVALAGAIGTGGLLVHWLRGRLWQELRRSASADLAVLMLTLVLPFTAPFGHLVFGWDAMAYGTTQELLRSAILVLITVMASAAIAYFWFDLSGDGDQDNAQAETRITFSQWTQMMGLFWVIQILFFTTFLTNTRDGLASGIVGSLGYWLAQQEVARGGQPWYYYIMLTLLYEFLPLFLTVGGGVVIVRRLLGIERSIVTDTDDTKRQSRQSSVVAASGHPLDSDENESGRPSLRFLFVLFLLWWTAMAWTGYTMAGEKMPWLLTHLALPMCILGGWWLGHLVNRIDWARAGQHNVLWLVAVAPALIVLAAILVLRTPNFGRTVGAIAETTQWLLAMLIAIGLVYLVISWVQRIGWPAAARLLTLGVVSVLALLTVRFTYLLNYVNYDLATEYLVYAHASPDIKRALREIDLISERTVGGANITVAYDDESSWPMSWYMRMYPNSRFYGSNPNSDVMSAPVIIVGPKNYEKVRPYVARDYVKRTYRLVWWPDQGYFGLTWERFWSTLFDRDKLRNIFQIVFYRRYPETDNPSRYRDLTQWPNRHDFEMYVRRDIAADIWDLSVTPVESVDSQLLAQVREKELPLSAIGVFAGTVGSTSLLTPREVAVGHDGSRIVADTGNHRIVVFDSSGAFQLEFGQLCRLGEGAAGGCTDPDGSGPLELGDGQFFEPWGISVDGQGNIYVADTWNGRIQVFDAEGKFLRKWGYFNSTNGELGDPYALFGPRGLAIDSQGHLLVADTGNKRILQFTNTGELVQQIGGGGAILGRFEEPVDVAVSPVDGSIYVADAWNRRIQKLDSALSPMSEWPVPGWDSKEIFHKPYIAIDGSGNVYITDPTLTRVLVYNSVGGIHAAFGTYGAEGGQFALPNGIAIDRNSGEILVADAGNNRVMLMPPIP